MVAYTQKRFWKSVKSPFRQLLKVKSQESHLVLDKKKMTSQNKNTLRGGWGGEGLAI